MANELAFTNHKEYAPLPKKIGKEAEGQQQAKAAENTVASGPARNNGLQWERTEGKGKQGSDVQISYQDTYVGPTTVTVGDSVKALKTPETFARIGDAIQKGIEKRCADTYKKGCELSLSPNRLQSRLGDQLKLISSFALSADMKKAIHDDVSSKLKDQVENGIEQCNYDGNMLQVIGGGGKKTKAQMKLLGEMQNQLLIQADLLGVRDRYSPTFMTELNIDSTKKIIGEFYAEQSNLEYEMNLFGSNKKEVLIKSERLTGYVKKAESLRDKYNKQLEGILEKLGGSRETRQQVGRVVSRLSHTNIKAAA